MTPACGVARKGEMSEFTIDDQWRSFQTFVATYLTGMLHPRDVFTISRNRAVTPPLVEYRCDAEGRIWFSIGELAWSDRPGDSVRVDREQADGYAAETVRMLRDVSDVDEPNDLRLSGSGPASSVAVLANAGFMSGGLDDPARKAVLDARMHAGINVEGDVIDAVAREKGDQAFDGTRSGSIASIAFAMALEDRRSWVDPFSRTKRTGYLVGGQPIPQSEE